MYMYIYRLFVDEAVHQKPVNGEGGRQSWKQARGRG